MRPSLFVITLVAQVAHGFMDSCDEGGVKRCSDDEPSYVADFINNTIVSNCIFINCPRVIIDLPTSSIEDTSTVLENITLKDPRFSPTPVDDNHRLTWGDVLHFRNSKIPDFTSTFWSRIVFNNLTIEGYRKTHSNASGTLVYNLGSNAYSSPVYYGNPFPLNAEEAKPLPESFISFRNSNFHDNKGIANIFQLDNGYIKLEDCYFSDNHGDLDSSYIAFNLEQSQLVWIGGRFTGSSGSLSTVIYAEKSSVHFITGVEFIETRVLNSLESKGLISSSIVRNTLFPVSSVYLDFSSSLTISNSQLFDCPGGFIAAFGKSSLFLHRSLINGHGTANRLSSIELSYSFLTIYDQTIVTGIEAPSSSSVSLSGTSNFNCQNSIFKENKGLNGGAVYGGEFSITNAMNCSFIGNKAIKNGGAIYSISFAFLLGPNVFSENYAAENGGAVFMEDNGRLQISSVGDFQLIGNKAGLHGGAFYLGGSSTASFLAPLLFTNSNNSATRGDIMAFMDDATLRLDWPASSESIMSTPETVYFESPALDSFFSLSKNRKVFRGKQVGRPALLKLLEPIPLSSQMLRLNQTIPRIRVSCIDSYGAPISIDFLQSLIVRVVEDSGEYSLRGESVKAIAVNADGIATFEDLQLEKRVPGNYIIRVETLPDQLKITNETNIHLGTSLTFNITYLPCIDEIERFSTFKSKCVPIVQTGKIYRFLFAILGIILSLITFSFLAITSVTRRSQFFNANSFSSQMMISAGSFIAWIPLALKIYPFSESCMMNAWLGNISFIMLLFGLLLDMSKAFRKSPRHRSVIATPEEVTRFLWIWFYISLGVIVVFLSIWTAVKPSVYADVFVSDYSKAWIDGCSQSVFGLLMIVGRMMFLVMAAIFAYTINEHRLLQGALIYTWVVFQILQIISDTFISSQNLSFVIDSLVQLIPPLAVFVSMLVTKIITIFETNQGSSNGNSQDISMASLNMSKRMNNNNNNPPSMLGPQNLSGILKKRLESTINAQ